ncbi:hypothetical protein BH10BAC4_BH10BAC4_03960 [soil metagenome]
MAKNKTAQTTGSVIEFISKVTDERKRDDSYQLVEIFKETTGFDASMWGPSIIGFGSYHYKYASGHEGDMCLAGFSPRKAAIVLYFTTGLEQKEKFLEKLGKYKGSKGCLYIKKLEDIDTGVLKKMITASVKSVKKHFPA